MSDDLRNVETGLHAKWGRIEAHLRGLAEVELGNADSGQVDELLDHNELGVVAFRRIGSVLVERNLAE